jgi:hypothetical protein
MVSGNFRLCLRNEQFQLKFKKNTSSSACSYIRAILKEEFSGTVTWIYNDLYNFIYLKEGTTENESLMLMIL